MPTTRSQSKAMSTPPVCSVLEEPESPKSASSQETPWSTQSEYLAVFFLWKVDPKQYEMLLAGILNNHTRGANQYQLRPTK